MITDTELFKILSEASIGLLFQTELDYPFEVFIHDNTKETNIKKKTILKLMNGAPEDPIEESNIDILFSIPILDQDWHTPEDKKRVARFRNLVSSIKENLKEIKVFRKGKIYIDVYITGRASSGNIVVVSTKQMQT
jgi:Nuclease A inhibitor-like protein